MKTTLLQIIQDYCDDMDASQIKPESHIMDDLELSSLDFFSMISEIEMEFDIQITEREIQEIATIGDLIHIVEDKAK